MAHLYHTIAPYWSREFTAHFRHIGIMRMTSFPSQIIVLPSPPSESDGDARYCPF